jgi:hypothetical protein
VPIWLQKKTTTTTQKKEKEKRSITTLHETANVQQEI